MFFLLINFSVVSAITTIKNSGNSSFSSGVDVSSNDVWADNFYGTSYWADLSGVPSGLADGDDDTTYTAGSNLSLAGTIFSVNTTSLKSWLDNFYQPTGNYLTSESDPFWSANFSSVAFLTQLNNGSYINNPLWVTNATVNHTVYCGDILGGPDSDFCTDAGAAGGVTWSEVINGTMASTSYVDSQNTSQNNWIAQNNVSIVNWATNTFALPSSITQVYTFLNTYFYNITQVTAVNTSMKNYVDSQDSSYNSSNNNYVASVNSSVTNALATKLSLSGGTMTGNITLAGTRVVNNATANAYIYHNGTGWVIKG